MKMNHAAVLLAATVAAFGTLIAPRASLAQAPATAHAPAAVPPAPARAPAPAPTDTPPDSLLDQAAVVKDARGLTAEKYPDADTILVSEHQRTQYNPDGSYVTLDDEYVKVLTEAGRKGSREQQFGFDASYGGMEVLAVEVIKPDGKVVSHDPSTVSKEQVDRSGMDANIFDPNSKVLDLSVPGLEIGDMLHVYTRSWESRPRMQDAFADICLFEAPSPIRRVVYEYVCPKERPLRCKVLLSEIKGTVTSAERTEGDTVICTWTGTDIPQLFPEPQMPEFTTVAQRLRVSTLADWKEVSRWYSRLTKPHLDTVTPAMKAKVAELTKGLATDDERIRAIFKFVSQEIRYMGITTETEAPGYEPHDVNTTFENRYGVCRDKAALLASLLSAAGIPSFPVIINAGDKLDAEAPSISFNHAITAARGADGKYILMDSTDESTADLLPPYLQDKSYLVATPEGETLMTSPVAAADDNMLTVKTTVKLADDGSATGRTDIAFEGINDNSYRGAFVQMKPADIRRSMESAVKSLLPGGKLTSMSLTPKDMKDSSQKIRLTLEWSTPGILVAGGNAAQLDLPFVGYGFGVATQMIGQGLQLEKRRFPLAFDQPCGVHEDVEISLPASLGAPIALPTYENTEHTDFSTVQRISASPGKIEASVDIRVKSPELAPDQYPVLKRAMAAMETNGRQQPVFARAAGSTPPPAPSADLEFVRYTQAIRMDAPDRWTTRREVKEKVLTPAGVKSASELQLDYNPVWQSVEVEYARVTQKDGTVRTVQPQEMNVMDASWVAAAPRYPGGKTLVVSLPGVEVGSTIEYAVRETQKDQPLFSGSSAFSSSERIDEMTLSYDMPAGVAPKMAMDFPAEGHMTETTSDGRRTLTFTWHDIEPRQREASAPPAWMDSPDFVMSTGSWPTYAADIGRRTAPMMTAQQATADKAKELTAGTTDPVARITAIRDFVARQIRMEGPGLSGLPLASAFSPADVTLKDGYGNFNDRAILLCSMLRSAGFDADLGLASWSTKEPTMQQRRLDFPAPGGFGGVVCRVKHPATGEWLPLDTLSQYAPLGATSLDGQPGFALDGTAFTWRAPTGMEDMDESEVTLDFDAEGTAVIGVTSRYRGQDHAGFVQHFTEMTPEERSRTFQAMVSGIAQNAVPQGDLVTDFAYPGTLHFAVKVDHYGVKNAGGLYFDLPNMPQSIMPTDADRRERALLSSAEQRRRTTWKISAPPGLTPIIEPEPLDWRGPGNLGSVRLTSERGTATDATRLTYVLELDLQPAVVPVGNYGALLELNRRFMHPSARRVLLQPAAKPVPESPAANAAPAEPAARGQ